LKNLFFTVRSLFIVLAMSLCLAGFPMSTAEAANLASGAKIFNANCSACHLGGNNLIIANKSLKKEALEKYKMNSLDAIKVQITKGKNAMPAFAGRLNANQIEDVATYVFEQSKKGW
jgi:cytochrome c6